MCHVAAMQNAKAMFALTRYVSIRLAKTTFKMEMNRGQTAAAAAQINVLNAETESLMLERNATMETPITQTTV